MIEEMIRIAKSAGAAIMEVYQEEEIAKELKDDHSPVTRADLWANEIIIKELARSFPDIPILSEEGAQTPYEERKKWTRFFLVDPLDGTKEFLKRNDEFTVNIAYVEGQVPKLGVVYAPALGLLYYNPTHDQAYMKNREGIFSLPCESKNDETFVMVTSRSHLNRETRDFLDELKCKFEDVEIIRMGSSLKMCLVAQGKAHAYPRLGPTSEWDTAAAHAIVKACGGEVYQYGSDSPLLYNKPSLINPSFEVSRTKARS